MWAISRSHSPQTIINVIPATDAMGELVGQVFQRLGRQAAGDQRLPRASKIWFRLYSSTCRPEKNL